MYVREGPLVERRQEAEARSSSIERDLNPKQEFTGKMFLPKQL